SKSNEVHGRDLDTDLLMLVIKRIMIERQDTYTKVILMSATLNAKKFMDYFPNWRLNGNTLGTVMVQIPHLTTYPVTEHYINNIHGIEMPKIYKVDFYEQPKLAPDIYEMNVNVASFDSFEKHERRYNTSKPDLPPLIPTNSVSYRQCSNSPRLSDYIPAEFIFFYCIIQEELWHLSSLATACEPFYDCHL
ncbi:unnamed protein product, partial [Allacma fusca]